MRLVNYIYKNENGELYHTTTYENRRPVKTYLTEVDERTPEQIAAAKAHARRAHEKLWG